MVVCKILLIFLAVVALNTRQSQSHALRDSTKDCACFPTDKNNIRISQLAETYGKHERKVIYLFRHLDSQKISIYVPNEEKQSNFPDLMVNSVESYDLHTQPHLYYIFDNPSTMVTVGEHLNYVVTNDKDNERFIYQHPTVKPNVNEIKVDFTGLHHGEPGYVIIDNGKNLPSNVHPNTGDNKLPLPLPEDNANSVTLAPGYEKIVVDLLNPHGKPSADTLNLIPKHVHDHELHPKQIVNETKVDSTDLHDGEPEYVVMDNEKNQPSNVHPNTGSKKLPLTLHEPNANSVNLIPGYENIVVNHLNPQKKPSANTLNLIPEHVHDHEKLPKQIVNEIKVDSTGLHHGEPGYVIIDNGKNQPSNVHPNTGDNKLPLPLHEDNANSVTLVPGYENIVVNHLNPQEKPSADTLNLIPEHGHDRELHPKQVVNEIKVDSAGLHHGEPGYVIIDNGNHLPSNVQSNTGDKKNPLTFHDHSANSVTLVPGYENIVVDLLNPHGKPSPDTLNLIPEHDHDHELHPKPSVNEKKVDSTGLHHGEPGYVVMDNVKKQPSNVHPNVGEHEHTANSVPLVPGLEKIVIDYLNGQKKDGVMTVKPTTGSGNDQYVQYIENINLYDNPKDSTLVESGRNIVVLDLYDKTASPLDLSNLNQNPKNIHRDSINEIEIISELPNKQESSASVSTIQKDGEHKTLDNTIYSPVTGYNFINRVQELLSQNVLPSSINLQPVNNPVVEKWLIGEINNIINSGPGTLPLLTVDLKEIKIRLLQILAQNGLQFTGNGYLIDIHGHIFKVTNLSLRRVLISDPVSYKKLLGRKCVTPLEIPYLEAIFVSLVHPPKVLGLIPLKMSSLSGCRRSKCTHRRCSSRKHKHVSKNPKHPSKLNLAPISDEGVHDRQHYSQFNTVGQHEVIKNLNHDDVIGTRIGDKEDDEKDQNSDDEDVLDIRIIGGNPATGSGTPVSSKGRSGHRQSEYFLSK